MLNESLKWVEWLRGYEMTDPEPTLTQDVRNQYVHKNSRDEMFLGPDSFGYRADEVASHVAWHARMTAAFMQSPLRQTGTRI